MDSTVEESKGALSREAKSTRSFRIPDIVFWAVVAILCVVRVVLACTQSYMPIPGSAYDDEMQNILAMQSSFGGWLGDYNQLKLTKGLAFPLFLKTCMALHVPFDLAIGCFIVASCLVFLFALRHVTTNRVALAVLFALVMFCPVAWGTDAGLRIYRNIMSPWVALVVMSCLVAIVMLRSRPLRSNVAWFLLLGFSLAFMVNLREDSIWIYPAVAFALVVWAVARVRCKAASPEAARSVKAIVANVATLVSPLLICGAVALAIAFANFHYYGVFLQNDRTQGPFADMVSEIVAIEDEDKSVDGQWFTKRTLDAAADASPTLGSIRDELDDSYSRWTARFDGKVVRGDFIQWVLRTAMSDAGYFNDAVSAAQFSEAVASELSAAFADGTLQRDSLIHPSSQGPGISVGDAFAYLPKTFENMARLASYSHLKDLYPADLSDALAADTMWVFSETTGMDFEAQAARQGSGAGDATAAVESALTGLYKLIGVPLLLLSAAAMVVAAVLVRRRGMAERGQAGIFDVLATPLMVLFSVFLYVYIVTLFVAFMGYEWPLHFYANNSYVLFLMFDALCIGWLVRMLGAKADDGAGVAAEADACDGAGVAAEPEASGGAESLDEIDGS